MKARKILALALSALILLAALPGAAAASEAPMGRYMETEMSMPEGFQTIHRLQIGPDGSLLLLGASAEGQILRAQSGADGAWDVQARDISGEAGALGKNLYDIAEVDGALWTLNMHSLGDLKFVMEVYRCQGDAAGKVELPKMPEQMSYPNYLAVSEEGLILLKEYNPGVRAYESEGGAERFFADGIDGSFAVWGDVLLGISMQNGAVEQYDLQTGALVSSMPVDSLTEEDAIATDGTSVYLVNHGGIYRAALGGQVWERLVDGGLTSLRMPTNYFVDLAILDGAFYLLTVSDGNYKLLRYQYDETVTAVPTKELRVYTLRTSSLLDQTIAQFQIENPDYLVSATTLLSADGGATASDVIRALNTELLAGKGPDVLLLDGMPADSYIEKGVLADLSPVVDPMLADGTLLPNLFAPFRTGEAIYQAPTSFGLPVISGRAEDLAKVQSLNDLTNFVAQYQGKGYALGLRPMQDRFTMLISTSFPAWFDESGALDEALFREFLEQVASINERCGRPETSFDVELRGRYDEMVQMGMMRDGAMRTASLGKYEEVIKIGQGRLAFYPFEISSFSMQMIEFTQLSKFGGTFEFLPGQAERVFAPSGMLGVNARSAQLDAALSFVRTALSQSVQDVDLYGNGLSVNAKSLQRSVDEESTAHGTTSVTGYTDEETGENVMIDGSWPTREMRERVLEAAKGATTPYLPDQTLLEMIYKELAPFFAGEMDAERATTAVAAKVRAYLAE